MSGRKRLSAQEVELFRNEYPTADLEELRVKLGLRSLCSLYNYAHRMGIRRDAEVHNRNKSLAHLEVIRKEKMRVRWGLPQKTRIYFATRLTHAEWSCRSNLRKKGYIPGDCRQQGERKIIYYTDSTVRRKKAEMFAKRKGFRFERLEE